MKLRDFKFNEIKGYGLSIFEDKKEVACGTIGEVLIQITHLADKEIKETNYYMDVLL